MPLKAATFYAANYIELELGAKVASLEPRTNKRCCQTVNTCF